MNVWFEWKGPDYNRDYYDAVMASTRHLKELVTQEQGRYLDDIPMYNDYAVHDTPLESIYGDNLPALRDREEVRSKACYDFSWGVQIPMNQDLLLDARLHKIPLRDFTTLSIQL